MKKISSISDFEKIINDLTRNGEKFIFRGQTEDKPLLPSIARNGLTADIEIKIFEEYKEKMKKASIDVSREEISSLDNDFEWIVLGQHYGLKTRCLDWTYFHGVALYFAVENAMDKDGVVWIYELPPNESDEWLSLAHRDVLRKKPFDFTISKIYHPKSFLDLRTDSQGAVVTICSHLQEPIEKTSESKRLRRMLIPAFSKPSILDELDRKGINYSSLFLKETKAKEIEDICRVVNSRYS